MKCPLKQSRSVTEILRNSYTRKVEQFHGKNELNRNGKMSGSLHNIIENGLKITQEKGTLRQSYSRRLGQFHKENFEKDIEKFVSYYVIARMDRQ